MPNESKLGHRHSPEEQLAGFSRTGLGKYVVLAIIVHAIVIVATSVAYLRAWADPAWAQEQKIAEEQAAADAVKNQDAMQEGKALQDERKAADSAEPDASKAPAEPDAESAKSAAEVLNAKIAKAFEDAGIDPEDPIVKERLSDVPKERWISPEIIDSVRPAKKAEIPVEPDILDISIDDTN
jgi:hypothetical protein